MKSPKTTTIISHEGNAEPGKNVTEYRYSLYERNLISEKEAYKRTKEFILNPKNFKIGEKIKRGKKPVGWHTLNPGS